MCLPQVKVFAKLFTSTDLSLEDIHELELFAIQMYQKDSEDTELDETKKKLVFEKVCPLIIYLQLLLLYEIMPCVPYTKQVILLKAQNAKDPSLFGWKKGW